MELEEYHQLLICQVLVLIPYLGLIPVELFGYLVDQAMIQQIQQVGYLNISSFVYLTRITASGQLNDLWKYNISTNQWTWMSGSNDTNQLGIYGDIGVPSNSSVPGSRYLSISWVDSKDTLWLFGGVYVNASVYNG